MRWEKTLHTNIKWIALSTHQLHADMESTTNLAFAFSLCRVQQKKVKVYHNTHKYMHFHKYVSYICKFRNKYTNKCKGNVFLIWHEQEQTMHAGYTVIEDKKIGLLLWSKGNIRVHPLSHLGLVIAPHWHHKCSLWPDSRGSNLWSDTSSPGMLLNKCHHRPPSPG